MLGGECITDEVSSYLEIPVHEITEQHVLAITLSWGIPGKYLTFKE